MMEATSVDFLNNELPLPDQVSLSSAGFMIPASSKPPTVELSESPAGSWKPFPQWAAWFRDFGYAFRLDSMKRSLTVISVPTDSAAAGLIALGLVRRRLELVWGEDEDGYYARILRCAADRRGILLKFIPTRAVYELLEPDSRGLRVRCVKGRQKEQGEVKYVMPHNVADWQLGDEPPVIVRSSGRMELSPVVNALFPDAAPVLESNLVRSDASVCLAVHANGRSVTERWLSDFRIRSSDAEASLATLVLPDRRMTQVARLSLVNSRTRAFYWRARTPDVTVCDGARSFMNLVRSKAIGNSSIIAVVSRVCSVDEADDLGDCLKSLEQWFEATDPPIGGTLPGLAIFHMEAR